MVMDLPHLLYCSWEGGCLHRLPERERLGLSATEVCPVCNDERVHSRCAEANLRVSGILHESICLPCAKSSYNIPGPPLHPGDSRPPSDSNSFSISPYTLGNPTVLYVGCT